MSTNEHLEVWYDGACSVCQRSRTWCEAKDEHERLRFIDFRVATDEQLPVARDELESAMWVRTTEGELLAGFDGWREILIELPRWLVLLLLSDIAPFRWLGPPIYGLIARFRHRLGMVRR